MTIRQQDHGGTRESGLGLLTDRLLIREWRVDDDAESALAIYGAAEVAHWLAPAMERVTDVAAMRSLLREWRQAGLGLEPPQGRWAVQRQADGVVVGGLVIRRLPPATEDLEVSWQLDPRAWGQGYATEAARALVAWAFSHDPDELFAVARPNNARAIATAKRIGMRWVGETTKYYGLRMQVYRIRRNEQLPLPERRGSSAAGFASAEAAEHEVPYADSIRLGRMG